MWCVWVVGGGMEGGVCIGCRGENGEWGVYGLEVCGGCVEGVWIVSVRMECGVCMDGKCVNGVWSVYGL